MKTKELSTKILENTLAKIVCIVAIGIIILSIVIVLNYNNNHEVDTEYLMAKLRKASELTTAELEYTGFSKFKDTGVPILNRSDFLLVYTATARAGIDIEKIKIDGDKLTKTIWITIPKAEILDVNVDQKEDSDKAQALAEEQAKKELSKIGILKMADDQAETLIKGLLQGTIPKDYKIKVKK